MLRVAIIDSDNDFKNKTIAYLSKHIPYIRIYNVTSYETALEKVRNYHCDIIIADAHFSGISGIEIVKVLKKEKHPAKFIILDGKSDFEAAKEAVKLGVFDYFTKPVKPAELGETIKRIEKILPKNAQRPHSSDDVRPMKDRFFSDLLAGRINNPVDLSIRLQEAELEANFAHRECALVNIHINSFSRWLSMCWDSGVGRFYQTFHDALPKEFDKVEIVFTRAFYSNLEIMCINNSQKPVTAVLEAFIPELSSLIMKTFGVYSEIHVSRVFSSVSEIMKFNLQDPVKIDFDSEKVVENAIKFIRHNYFREITLEDVSNYVMLSREYFCSFYKQKTGENFIETLNKHRVEMSKKLLTDSNLTVNQVAESVGYRSTSHYHKIFKKLCNMSPKEFRKSVLISGIQAKNG